MMRVYIIECFEYFIDDICCNFFREMTVFDNLIKELISLKILGDDIPFLWTFEVLIYFDYVRMI
jgi:hypothetical protein